MKTIEIYKLRYNDYNDKTKTENFDNFNNLIEKIKIIIKTKKLVEIEFESYNIEN